jgi:hypothetical protein
MGFIPKLNGGFSSKPGDRHRRATWWSRTGKNTRITHWPCSIPPINPSWRFPKSWEYTPIYHPCDFRIFHWNHPAIGDPPLMEPPSYFEALNHWTAPGSSPTARAFLARWERQQMHRKLNAWHVSRRMVPDCELENGKWSNYSFYNWKKIRVGYFNSW